MIDDIAEAIDPQAFDNYRRLYDRCIEAGDGPDHAKKCADAMHGTQIEKAKAKARAALSVIQKDMVIVPTHKHDKSGGLYRMIDDDVRLEATNTRAVLYQGMDGVRWVRDYKEFFDGRFSVVE